ncbi:M12 family metallo-peptidase [Hymenobacter sp. 15J16-1T3B]|uniref:reprolysin-like metallopeptidase n=1 Tax=Hymenobacter sp. 15J16-1T3B TaxID=2886941 RepID=UPI001D10B66B|nr:zinc-dependent metalloprotease family protein [Hymenobacter sp. 15J16-1T3B]MCC3158296.1 M12 family metallo-peptidase [Hymenobacter sp. 15J16-1T3B]
MIKKYLHTSAYALALGLGLGGGAQAQQRAAAPYFQDDATAARSALGAALRHSRPLTLNAAGLRTALAAAPAETRAGAAPLTLALPLPDGTSGRFAVTETAVMAPALAAQFPQIKTYRGVGLDDPTATVRLDVTPQGFHAQILSETAGTVYIDPATRGDQQHVLSFYRRDMNRAAAGAVPVCQFQPTAAELAASQMRGIAAGNGQNRVLIATGPTLRTYRLAVAATGEYTAFHGGTVALAQAAIVTTVNRVVGVYEKELAVRLQLVGSNAQIIYTDGGSDPYTNGRADLMIGEAQTNITNVIGTPNFDIGHVFGTNSGGYAGLGVVCNASFKARGVTGSSAPLGDAFDIDYVAHEMGHQFGGNHTFNSASGPNCGTSNGNPGTAFEPGSGSTIMAYAGICAPDNLQPNSDAYFHTGSFQEMAAFIASTACGTSTATGNTAPVVSIPAARTLPIGTPFRLTASATDANGDALTYCWEEMDLGAYATLTTPQAANSNVPLFRSFLPVSSPTRYFPRLADIISNTSSANERLPTVSRTLTFRCTARDQHNGAAGVVGGVNYSANLVLPVTSAAGPFLVTAPNTALTWTGSSTQTVTWNVAGTTANGVNCATVNILLSTDGGLTYPTTLASGVANDGSQAVTVPNVATTTARIMVEAADNYFFDISNTNFTITAAVCNAPTNLSAGSITQTTASVSFTASGSATSYTVTTTPATSPQTVAGSPVTLTGLTPGTSYTVNIVSNCAGGATSAAASTVFSTTQPATAAPVLLNPANGSLTNNTRPPYTGTATPGSTVTVYIGASSVGSATTDASGNWTMTSVTLLADGVYTASATAQASGGAVSPASNSNTFTVDTTPPAAPVVVVPANGSQTSNNRPLYGGSGEAGATVTVFVDGTPIGTTTAVPGGTWGLSHPTALADGSHTVKVRATDAAGNTSVDSNTNTFAVDTTAPTATLSSSAGASGASTATTPLPFAVSFSESVTGFSASGISVTNGTVSSGPTGSGSGPYTFSVTPTTAGTATTVQVAAGAAQDAAGNGNLASSSYSLTYLAPATATTWTGAVSTDWYTAGNWTAGVPTASLDATIPSAAPRMPLIASGVATTRSLSIGSGASLTQTGGTLDVRANLTNNGTFGPTGGTVVLGSTTLGNLLGSSSTRFWNLTVSSNGAQVSTSAGAAVRRLLTLNGNLASQGNPLTLASDATNTAMVVNNGSNVVTGNLTVQRYITPDLNPNLGYRHVSAPISTATVGSLATAGFSPVVNPAYNGSATPAAVTPFPTVFGYDQSRLTAASNNLSTFDKGWFSPGTLNDALNVGQGYTVNLAAGQALSFTGPQNNGTLAVALGRNSGATAADAGLALVGNPYPSPLDWSLLSAADRPNVDGSIYVFASNDPSNAYAGAYGFYNNGIGTISPVLPLGQGFFVRVTAGQTAGTLTFRNSQRPTAYTNPTYHRPNETRPLVQLALRAAGSAVSDAAFVYFEQGATDGYDAQYDAEKLPNPSGLNLSTSLSATQRLSIDGRAELGTAPRVVPLAVGVPAPGTYSLSAAELLNLAGVPTYLRDLQTGAVIDLAQQPSYQFTVTNATSLITGRFELVFSPQRPLATAAAQTLQLSVWPNPVAGQAPLHLTLSKAVPAATATLRDVVGRTVATQAFAGSSTSLPTAGLARGTYLLSVTAAGQAPVTRRVVVE